MYSLILPFAIVAFLATHLAAHGHHDSDYVEEYYHRLRIGRGRHITKESDFRPPADSHFRKFHGKPPPPSRQPESSSESSESTEVPPPDPSARVPRPPLHAGSVESAESAEIGSDEMPDIPPPPPPPMKARSLTGYPEKSNSSDSSNAAR
uniref:Uncharacterized protein n=1 Tax=Trichuris muris TaxID=70415 RepID=A0A5S6QEW2_TRIMR